MGEANIGLIAVLAVLGGLSLVKKLVVFAVPDIRATFEEIFGFCEWFRARWLRFREGSATGTPSSMPNAVTQRPRRRSQEGGPRAA